MNMERNKEHILSSINDLLKLIDQANASSALHKQIHTDTPLLYEQYERLKNNYLYQLAQLLHAFDVKVELPDQAD
jgi:hypothetical protein